MVKKLTIFGIVAVMILGVVGFTACGNSQELPNGWYHYANETGELLGWGSDYGWYIKGNKAELYSSGLRTSKCKIVEKDGKLYFEGYHTYGEKNALMLEIEYCGSTKILTIGTSDKTYFLHENT